MSVALYDPNRAQAQNGELKGGVTGPILWPDSKRAQRATTNGRLYLGSSARRQTVKTHV
jgi:hypothetical protein